MEQRRVLWRSWIRDNRVVVKFTLAANGASIITGATFVGVRKKPRIYMDSFWKANLITETPYIFSGKVKNKIHTFVKALFILFLFRLN